MENNDAFRENLAKKALPTREFFNVPIGGGYSKYFARCIVERKQLSTAYRRLLFLPV